MIQNTAPRRANTVPVSIIAGFLGSGKTTLLNRLIRHEGMSDTALIVNEFGEIGIDHALVESALDNTYVLDSGCLCCTIRGDLVDTIADLFAKAASGAVPAFSRILIEPTGLADPGPVVGAIEQLSAARQPCERGAVITMVDGQQAARQLNAHDEVARQIALADVILISKTDTIDADAVQSLASTINTLNPGVPVRPIVHGDIDPDVLFGLASKSAVAVPTGTTVHSQHNHAHGEVSACVVTADDPLDWDRLRIFLETLYSLRGDALLRTKGIVWIEGQAAPVVIQGVGNGFSRPRLFHGAVDAAGTSRLVFIHNGLDDGAIEASFATMVRGGK